MPVRQSLRNLQSCGAFVEDFTSEKLKMTIMRNYSFSIYHPWYGRLDTPAVFITLLYIVYNLHEQEVHPRSHPAKPWINFHSPDP
jgi:hypothetical protein